MTNISSGLRREFLRSDPKNSEVQSLGRSSKQCPGARTGGGHVAERAQLGTGNGGHHEPEIRSSTRETKERAMWPTG